MTFIDTLKKFGLSEKESKTYLGALELGSASATQISIKTDLPRTLVYDLLEKLIDLRLMTYTIKNNKKQFTPSDPQELIMILKEKEIAIKKILPQLNSLQKEKKSIRPKITIYEGIEGMKSLMNHILNSNITDLFVYGSSKVSIRITPAFINDWHKRRISKKITMNVIYNDTPEARNFIKKNKSHDNLMKCRFMQITNESYTATMIFDNKIAIENWGKDPFSVLIENEELATNHVRYFNELWKLTKK